jgi:hypothetical protein
MTTPRAPQFVGWVRQHRHQRWIAICQGTSADAVWDSLLDVYRDAMNTVVKRHLADGSMDWFKALPYAEKIRLCRHPERNWDEIDRLKRAVNCPKPAPSCSGGRRENASGGVPPRVLTIRTKS